MKHPRITSNQSEGSMLVVCNTWKQFKNLMTGIGVSGAEYRYGLEKLSVRIFRVNRFNISVATVKGWCNAG